jgi:hypothetical protein
MQLPVKEEEKFVVSTSRSQLKVQGPFRTVISYEISRFSFCLSSLGALTFNQSLLDHSVGANAHQ